MKKQIIIFYILATSSLLAQTNSLPAVTISIKTVPEEAALEPADVQEVDQAAEPVLITAPPEKAEPILIPSKSPDLHGGSEIEPPEPTSWTQSPEPMQRLDPVEPADRVIELYEQLVRKRLEIGMRSMSKDLDETMRGNRQTRVGTYFGTINEIKLTGEGGNKLFFQYAFVPYFGVGITSDEMIIATRDGPTERHSDGDVTVDSSLTYLFVRYPVRIPETDFTITPFFEYGKADHDIGFNPEASWAARGNGVNLDDDSGSYTAYGLEITYADRVALQAYWRSLSISTEGAYTVTDGRRPVPIDMRLDNEGFAFGLKVIF